MRICKTCKKEFDQKKGKSYNCNKCVYNRSKMLGNAQKYDSRGLMKIPDCLKWVEARIRANYNITALELMRMIGVYESMGGRLSHSLDYKTKADQLDYMWKFIKREYDTIKAGEDDFFVRKKEYWKQYRLKRLENIEKQRAERLKNEKNEF